MTAGTEDIAAEASLRPSLRALSTWIEAACRMLSVHLGLEASTHPSLRAVSAEACCRMASVHLGLPTGTQPTVQRSGFGQCLPRRRRSFVTTARAHLFRVSESAAFYRDQMKEHEYIPSSLFPAPTRREYGRMRSGYPATSVVRSQISEN